MFWGGQEDSLSDVEFQTAVDESRGEAVIFVTALPPSVSHTHTYTKEARFEVNKRMASSYEFRDRREDKVD